jgi:hypothetical protein
MTQQAVISGRIVDANGQPRLAIVGLLLSTYGRNGERTLNRVSGVTYQALTNDKGEFRLPDLSAGQYYLYFLGDSADILQPGHSYYPGITDEVGARPIHVNEGEEVRVGTLTLPARPNAAELRLHITGPSGRPLRTMVQIVNVGGRLLRSASNSSEFVLKAFPGRYEILLTDEGTSREPDNYYERLSIDVGSSNVLHSVTLRRAPRLTGVMVLENEAGMREPAPASVVCRLVGSHNGDCLKSQPWEGSYDLEFRGLPSDMYVRSAKVDDRDILAEGLTIRGDSRVEIVLARSGAITYGTVRDSRGDVVPDATVAVVPDPPYRNAEARYRSVITDHKGQFEIHGIAPGAYKLFAWGDVEGFAYRNSEFIKAFEDRGKPIEVQKEGRIQIDLLAF